MTPARMLGLLLIVGTACSQDPVTGPGEEIPSAPDLARRPGFPPFGPLPEPPKAPPTWSGAPTQLTIVKTAIPSDGPIGFGESFWFDVTVTNTGSADASHAFLTDDLPDFATSWAAEQIAGEVGVTCFNFGSFFGCGGFESGPSGEDFVGVDLAPGASYTVRFTATNHLEDCGAVTNTASVVADNASAVSDDASLVVSCPPTE